MDIHNRGARPLATILGGVLALTAAFGTVARADQSTPITAPPVIIVRAPSGNVTIVRGDDSTVSVQGNPAAGLTEVPIQTDAQGRIALPSAPGMPSRRIMIPGIEAGSSAIRIDDPGGDVSVVVPQHVAAILVKADGGSVSMSDTRGPYVILAPNGSVTLFRVAGFGNVRTTAGSVNMTQVGGFVHVETAMGTVTGTEMYSQRAEINTQGGDIQWNFARVGDGPYRFTSSAGDVHVGLDERSVASIDAQSNQGSVVNRFGPRFAMVRYQSLHATSLNLGGGGPQITAMSQSGKVDIGPRLRPRP
ncbi:MAG TPA: DUF4097 family beta strand repeat-containing protein [Candidatus Eremiobacteraceae bacterium]|nr:DUF4097 family beta strand repeat-containing protein [Candidatus Eremiobacteraceae bacterium]